jgi:hypothetical protein
MDDSMKIAGLVFGGLCALFPATVLADTPMAQPAGTSLPSASHSVASHTKASLFTIITTSDPQTQLMALTLTRAALVQGETPRILLCSSAGDLALRDTPATGLEPQLPLGTSPVSMLQLLVSEKVEIQVCATYLPNRNLEKSALSEGVGMATPPEITKILIDRSVRVLSF